MSISCSRWPLVFVFDSYLSQEACCIIQQSPGCTTQTGMFRFYFLLDSSSNHKGFPPWNSSLLTFFKAACLGGCFPAFGRILNVKKEIFVQTTAFNASRVQTFSFIHKHETHYPSHLSKLINVTWHELLFTCKEILSDLKQRVNEAGNFEDLIKHDLIKWCRIGIDFYSTLEKKKRLDPAQSAIFWQLDTGWPFPSRHAVSHPIRND